MSYQGMDPEVLRRVAQQLRVRAAELDSVVAQVQHSVESALVEWEGEDAFVFEGWWGDQHRPALVAAHEALVGLAQSLDNNVAEQEGVSGVGGSVRSDSGRVPPAAALTAANLMTFAAAAYGKNKPLPAGWRDPSKAELAELGLRDVTLHTSSGLDARLLTDGRGHYVLSYAGSVTGSDWEENARTLTTNTPKPLTSTQVEEATDLAHLIALQVGAENLTLTGHSLGGREAALASLATGARAVTFNAAGATDEDVLYARTLGGQEVGLADYALTKLTFGASTGLTVDQSDITNYVTTDDPLTTAQQYVPGVNTVLRDALGRQVVVPHLSVTGHKLDSFESKI